MIPELGLILLLFATLMAVMGAGFGFAGSRTQVVTGHVTAVIFSVLSAFVILLWSFWQLDFTVSIVHAQAHADLPWYYRISAAWGGHEGSMLLWVSVLSLWSLYVLNRLRASPLYPKIATLICVLYAGLLSFIVFTSNPFARYLPMQPLEGQDLNPLLQDPLMVIHPPILYAGYVGFAMPCVIALAALWQGDLSLDTQKWLRKTALLAFMFLTLGITLGSFWAYYELGWGGWWFWDPVENASLMPWLSGLALIHLLSLSIHRQQYQAWMLFLCILTFALSILGTFLVRSGVLTSVHSFAADPKRGFYILALFAGYTLPALYLYARRAAALATSKPYVLFSREGLMLINSGLFVAMTATVALGTLYPLVLEAWGLGVISVGAPYFNTVMVPIFAVAVLGMVWAPVTRWGSSLSLQQTLCSLLTLGLVTALMTVLSSLHVWTAYAIAIAVWVLGYSLISLRDRSSDTLSTWGMRVAHMGVAILMLGVALSTQYGVSQDLRLRLHDSVQVGDYTFTLSGLKGVKGSNFDAMQADFDVREGKFHTVLSPQKRYYFARQQFISQTAIEGGLTRDIYIALAQPVEDAWDVRIYIKPFQRWIWAGGLVILLGAGLSFYDRRYLQSWGV